MSPVPMMPIFIGCAVLGGVPASAAQAAMGSKVANSIAVRIRMGRLDTESAREFR
jgi:hypothetical protein